MKKMPVFSLILALCLLLSACTLPQPNPPVEPAPPVHEPTEEEIYAVSNPLTGELTETDISTRRPYAFSVNNIQKSLPQFGVGKADIIFEALVEGGITRMVALFQDITGVGAIGSIRSARPYLIDFALSFDAIFVHAGGSPQAYEDIKNKNVTDFDGVNGTKGMDIFYRDAERRKTVGYEHSMFTSSELIGQYIEPMEGFNHNHASGYRNSMHFKNEPLTEGKPAKSVTTYFTRSKSTAFFYDENTKEYTVSQFKKDYIDGNTKEKVSVKNIVCLYTDVENIRGDDAGRLYTRTTGDGTGYFVCDGLYIPIKWSRESDHTQFVFTKEDGTPVYFGRGATYICVLKNGADVRFAE